jgi:hypothetical protein
LKNRQKTVRLSTSPSDTSVNHTYRSRRQ